MSTYLFDGGWSGGFCYEVFSTEGVTDFSRNAGEGRGGEAANW
jgi:hypothetical protein